MTEPAGLFKRLLKRIGSALLVIGALGIGNFIVNYTPDVDTAARPFLRGGEQGEVINARTFRVTLLKTRTAGVVRSSGVEHDTQGVWVLVRLRLEAIGESHSIGFAALVDGKERTFYATDRFQQPIVDGSHTLQPGIPVQGEVVFEVPKDATGLTLRVFTFRILRQMQTSPDIPIPLGENGVWLNRDPVVPDALEVKS